MEYDERTDGECEATLYFSDAEFAVTSQFIQLCLEMVMTAKAAQVLLQRYLRHHYKTKTMEALARGARAY